jgi:hypothetical protein
MQPQYRIGPARKTLFPFVRVVFSKLRALRALSTSYLSLLVALTEDTVPGYRFVTLTRRDVRDRHKALLRAKHEQGTKRSCGITAAPRWPATVG